MTSNPRQKRHRAVAWSSLVRHINSHIINDNLSLKNEDICRAGCRSTAVGHGMSSRVVCWRWALIFLLRIASVDIGWCRFEMSGRQGKAEMGGSYTGSKLNKFVCTYWPASCGSYFTPTRRSCFISEQNPRSARWDSRIPLNSARPAEPPS